MKKAIIVLSWTKGEPKVEYCGTELEKGLAVFDGLQKKPGGVQCLELIKDGRRKRKRTLNGSGFGVVHSKATPEEQEKSKKAAEEFAAKVKAEAESEDKEEAKEEAKEDKKNTKGK